METTRENENLIPNPSFNQKKDEVDRNSGVEMIHYPRNDIAHCEDVEEGKLNDCRSTAKKIIEKLKEIK